MLRNLKIAHQGLILVLLPVVFEIVFITLLGLQLNKTYVVLESVNASRRFGQSVESICQDVYALTEMMERMRELRGALPAAELKVISEKLLDIRRGTATLIETSPDERMRKRAESVAVPINASTKIFGRLIAEFKQEDFFQVVMIIKRKRNVLANGRDNLFASLSELLEAKKEQQADYDILVKQQAKSLHTLMGIVLVGGVLHVMLALFLWLMFSRDTADCFRVLMDNTCRLALGQPLNPLISGKGEIAHLDRVFQDMAQALDAARRKERAIIENAIDVICSFDKEGKFTAVSPACQTLFGYQQSELVGTHFYDLIFSDDRFLAEKTCCAIINGDGRGQFATRAKRQDGAIVDVLWAIQWSDIEQLMFCVAHDITKQKEIERLKQEFVAMISHDLRTPLMTVQMTLSMLNNDVLGKLPEGAKKQVSGAESSVQRLISLINDLLDIEKMEAGKLQIIIDDVMVQDVFERTLVAVDAFAKHHGVLLHFEPSEIEFRADGDRLVQVLVNLVSNAIKFSPKDSLVRLEAVQVDETVEVRVIDQGRGIPAEFIDSIFDRFQQVEAADATKKGGTGLGLAICKAIVEAHQGEIGIESEEGRGCTFWFRLPLHRLVIEKTEEVEQIEAVSLRQPAPGESF